MGILRKMQQASHIDGEPAVDRTRKDLVVPLYMITGLFSAIWTLAKMSSIAEDFTTDSKNDFAGVLFRKTAGCVASIALLPAGIYIMRTRKISRELCEYPAIAMAVATILFDAGAAFRASVSYAFLNVVVLDCLLVCNCRISVARCVITFTVAWMLVRSVMDAENVSGSCVDCSKRFSMRYILDVTIFFGMSTLTFLLDFHFTRGFAKAMMEQKALVEASVRMCEKATVLLAKYETDATRSLLEGSEADQLPPLLLSALLQLVGNVARYRPYLPQSCLQETDNAVEEEEVAVTECAQSTDTDGDSNGIGSRMHTAVSRSEFSRCARGALSDPVHRRVSMLAVNTKSFLEVCTDREIACSFIQNEVDEFFGVVLRERGVVDVVSGDHLYACFNASRMCTTHRVSAARAAWSLAGCGGAASRRTAAACSSSVLCGDFGTSEVRRFMILGAAFNALQCLERVAAQQRMLLVDEVIDSDADVVTSFFSVLVERVCFLKQSSRPFLVWWLAGQRAANANPGEWMYELDGQAPNPHEPWNRMLLQWLHTEEPVAEEDLEDVVCPLRTAAISRKREQTYLHEAGASGNTVVFGNTSASVAWTHGGQ